MKKNRILLFFLSAFMLLTFAGCAQQPETETYTSLSDFADQEAVFGIPSDFVLDDQLREICPQMSLEYYDDFLLGIEAVRAGKIDGYVCGKNYYENAQSNGGLDGLYIIEEPVHVYYCGLALSDEAPIENYQERVNTFLAQLQADGTLDEMRSRWYDEEDPEMPEIPMPENPEYTLRIVTHGKEKPYNYIKNGEYVGFDVELAYRVAAYLNCDLTMDSAEFPAMLMGIATGKYDMIASNLYIAEEREEHVLYSDPYNSVEIVVAVQAASEDSFVSGLAETLSDGFQSTFIKEGRWKLIVNGLLTTLFITVFGFALANIFGGIFCALAMSRRKFGRLLADIYSRLMQGLPLMVLLMILFYVIFGHSSVSGVFVSILGFGLASGATLAQQFEMAINSVSKGQREASLALGFTKLETMKGIVFPQAVRRLLPGYFSELIALMKGTAIVGYVAVLDLTKASDLIRGSTYDAFFPLISVAIVYFLVAFLLLSILKCIQKKLAPKRAQTQKGDEAE